MPRNFRFLLIVTVLVAITGSVLLFTRTAGSRVARGATPADVDAALAEMRPGEMPAQAEAFLATDRPWRAARVMRSYRGRVNELSPEHRVLAARAEAGWGAWPEVRALLEGLRSLDTYDDGIGLYLLARARDATGDAANAVQAYRSFLALSAPAGRMEEERAAARLRLGLVLARQGSAAEAAREMQVSAARVGGASVWLDLLHADALARRGDTAAVRAAVARFSSGLTGLRAWRTRIAAARHAGDLAGARSLANEARAWASTRGTQAEFMLAAARAALDMGDAAAGRSALRSVIDLEQAGPYAREAVELLRTGQMTAADHLSVARVNRAQGLHEESLESYRRWLDSGQGRANERAAVVMEYANALFYAGRYDEVGAALRPVAGQGSARLLHARAEAHRGNRDEAVRLYLSAGSGAYPLYLAATARHDDNAPRRARELYQRIVSQHPRSSQVGLTMMRLAGMAFLEERYSDAAQMWDQYRSRFPRGEHALQSTYWAGRARLEVGDSAAAAELFRSVMQRSRDSYYALLASRHLGVPFWPLPMGATPPADPAASQRVAELLRGLDLLRAAGFPDEASAEADRVVAVAGRDPVVLYPLAEALAERGYSQRAIRIGLDLQKSEQLNRRLLRILYPFPYRTLITEEARGRDLDPFIAAALIRQESMFESRITSHVGARGLMQIMPATGGGLADSAGIEPWDAELLYHPEINVHLGTYYLARHSTNYGGALPAIFSAYNAGAHRVEWWRKWPEFSRDDLFTERIPFAETRGYVRILTRNHALYRGLYGETD
ncbi:MAG TPA: transglycosylase SLT domain-containing protein [Gemmatimonadaceae bacterium]|nr:transglycosylase SLT domain-containing protein [Gemmatimonadaceae bacterium]